MKQYIYVVVDDHGYHAPCYLCAYPDHASAERIAEEINAIRRRHNYTVKGSNAFDKECARSFGFDCSPSLYAEDTRVEEIEIRSSIA